MAIWATIVAAVKAAAAAAAKAAASTAGHVAGAIGKGAVAIGKGASALGNVLTGGSSTTAGTTGTTVQQGATASKAAEMSKLAEAAKAAEDAKLVQASTAAGKASTMAQGGLEKDIGNMLFGGQLGNSNVESNAAKFDIGETPDITSKLSQATLEETPTSKLANNAGKGNKLENAAGGVRKASLGGLGKSFFSGLVDMPLPKDANMWDYLAKTGGQIGRLNEGSGLGLGSAPAPYEKTEVQSDLGAWQKDMTAVPARLKQGESKEQLMIELVTKYPDLASKIKMALYPNQPVMGGYQLPTE